MKMTLLSTFIIICALCVASCGAGDGELYTQASALMDGQLDNDTPIPAMTPVSAEVTEADVELMVHLVVCEAGDMPYMTQVCFAAMVLNRVEDPYFPRGVRGVVFESGDFSTVLSGKVTGTLPDGFENSRRYRIAKKAVEEAMDGLDPTNGAVYFSTAAGKSVHFSPSYECGGMSFGF